MMRNHFFFAKDWLRLPLQQIEDDRSKTSVSSHFHDDCGWFFCEENKKTHRINKKNFVKGMTL